MKRSSQVTPFERVQGLDKGTKLIGGVGAGFFANRVELPITFPITLFGLLLWSLCVAGSPDTLVPGPGPQ